MMKILKSAHISPFGGLNFILQEFDHLGIGHLLDQQLPPLPRQSKYNWRDLFYSFWSILFCGGSCAEDLGTNFNASLSNIPGLAVPSPDTLLQRMKQLAEPVVSYTTPRGKRIHQFSHHDPLNLLNIRLLKSMPSFERRNVTLDYDNTLLFNRKADAQMTYCKQFGYAPGVGIIGNKIVYVENRNGNSDPQTLQQDTLGRMFEILKTAQITVDKFRADSASYQFPTLMEISKNTNLFYIRARLTQPTMDAIQQVKNWKKIEVDGETIYRGDVSFIPFTSNKQRHKEHPMIPYRLVVTKVKRRDGQLNAFTKEACLYAAILTNDTQMSTHQVVDFYNQRGAREKEFDILKNDFCWNHMPFSTLNQNTVYLLLTAMCRNLYDHIIQMLSAKVAGLRPTDRLKKLIFRFICIPAKWVKSARVMKLRVYGNIDFKT